MFHSSRQGAVQIISVEGPWQGDQAPDAEQMLVQCEALGQARIVVNLESVPLIDSAALETLLDIRDRCRARGGALRLAAPSRLCHEIFLATGLDGEMEIFDDLLEAIGAFAQ